MRAVLSLLSLLACSSEPPPASEPIPVAPDELDAFLLETLQETRAPGLSAALVADGAVQWAGAYGIADEDSGADVATDTAFMLASVSKTVTAVALMQLYDDGLFDLDADINDALDFDVHNPAHPDEPITYRQLLTHSSSIDDNWDTMLDYYVEGDSSVGLGAFLADYLDPAGAEYQPGANYHSWAPGTGSVYSNIGAALAGYMVEALSGVPFDDHCDARIFAPLHMDHTGWHLEDFEVVDVAIPHAPDPVPHYGYPDYPNGQLRSSASDIGAFLAAFANGGISADGTRILQATTVDEMQRVQFPSLDPSMGLIWWHTDVGGAPVIGHNGGDLGVSTDMYFRGGETRGFVALFNGEPGSRKVADIHERLLEEVDAL